MLDMVKRTLHAATLAAGMLVLAGCARAVEIAAPYIPTAPSVVDRMLEIAKVGPGDYVIDLGSGDGRIVITAAKKYGARGFGVEIDPELVARAKANARAAGVSDRVDFRERDLFATDLSMATVVTTYLLRGATLKLRSRLLDLRPGTRIVSHTGSMGEWRPDYFEMLDVEDKVRPDAPTMTYIQLWTVPAKIAGDWRWSMPVGARTYDYDLAVSQQFQRFSGKLRLDGKEVSVEGGRLQGDGIAFDFNAEIDGSVWQHRMVGRVTGRSMAGTAALASERGQEERGWKASRVASPRPASAEPVSAPVG